MSRKKSSISMSSPPRPVFEFPNSGEVPPTREVGMLLGRPELATGRKEPKAIRPLFIPPLSAATMQSLVCEGFLNKRSPPPHLRGCPAGFLPPEVWATAGCLHIT